MNVVLLDTDVFSYLLRKGDTRASLCRLHVQNRLVTISFVTVGELYYWSERRKWGPERLRLFEEGMRAAIVVPYNPEICKTYAKLKCGLKTPSGSHRFVGDNDLWIAACAVTHAIPLITHNRRHFEGIPGLNIVSEAP